MDNLTKAQRKKNMARIRSTDTTPEMKLRSALHKEGFRFRIHVASLPGKPDIVLPKYRLIIFVNGCFWHQHPNCAKANIPKSNQDYWIEKLKKNVDRDKVSISNLKSMGWEVKVIWECEVNKNIEEVVETIKKCVFRQAVIQ